MPSELIGALVLLLAVIVARRLPWGIAERLDPTPLLVVRTAVWTVGVLTSAICAWVWGHVHPTAVFHDEASILLQARIFAGGAFAMPSPPLPEFFEQFHVYVVPAFASKYPPGHPLLVAIGAAIGWTSLVPILLNGVSGALLFLLVRRIATPVVALATWFVWIGTHAVVWSLASYFSQTTSTVLWLLGWYSLLSWRDGGRRTWLLLLAGCVGWLAITRPLTAVAFALPIIVVVMVLGVRRRCWRDLVLAVAVGALPLLLLPYANQRLTGDWRIMPYSRYSEIYFPFDAPGLGLDATPPARALPPDMLAFGQQFAPVHIGHVTSALPRTLANRITATASEVWRGSRLVLAVAAIVALPFVGVEVGFAIATVLATFVGYLSFAHDPRWTLYYSEALPLFAFLGVAGTWRLLGGRRAEYGSSAHAPAAALAMLTIVLVAPTIVSWQRWRGERIAVQRDQRAFADMVEKIPEPRAMVFIRHAPWHDIHRSYIANDPDIQAARAWRVYDRGTAENTRLMRLSPDRTAYLFDEERRILRPYAELGQ